MAVATTVAPDVVMSIEVGPDPLENYSRLRGGREGGPLIKCRPGRLTLVSPSKDHEFAARRLDALIMAVCSALRVPFRGGRSILYRGPETDRGYEPDDCYYLGPRVALAGTAGDPGGAPPDLVVEVVNTHPARDALESCRLLGVREVWVYDVRRGGLTIHRRVARGPRAGTYVPGNKSGVLPLSAAEVEALLAETAEDEAVYHRAVRRWIKRVLLPRERKRDANE